MKKRDFQENKDMDQMIKNEDTFTYKYSAEENKEIQEIRKKYLPQGESKLEELRRLDLQVKKSGVKEALCVGIISSLIFGLGMCLAMQVIGSGVGMMILGIVIGLIGMAGMITAYPVFCAKQRKMKEKLSPKILELTEELYQGERNV